MHCKNRRTYSLNAKLQSDLLKQVLSFSILKQLVKFNIYHSCNTNGLSSRNFCGFQNYKSNCFDDTNSNKKEGHGCQHFVVKNIFLTVETLIPILNAVKINILQCLFN